MTRNGETANATPITRASQTAVVAEVEVAVVEAETAAVAIAINAEGVDSFQVRYHRRRIC